MRSRPIEQVTHYYPFGGIFYDASAGQGEQPYKYNGKELDRMHGLDRYDYGFRHFDPLIHTWDRMDPLCEKYYPFSPYCYCMANPVNYVDPNGEDVEITLEDHEITIRANIILKGEYANEQLTTVYMMGLEDTWMRIEYIKDKATDEVYHLNWDIDIRPMRECEVEDYNGINNYFEVVDHIDDNGRLSFVSYCHKGNIGCISTKGLTLIDENPMPHEFGHIMGLWDRYNPKYKYPLNGWMGNIMAEAVHKKTVIDSRNLTSLFRPILDMRNHASLIRRQNVFIYYINKDHREKK